MVSFGDVVEAPVVPAGPDGAVLLNHYVQGRGPRTGGLLAEPLLLHILKTPLRCSQPVRGEASESCVDGRPCGLDVVPHRVFGRSLRGPQFPPKDVLEGVPQGGVVVGRSSSDQRAVGGVVDPLSFDIHQEVVVLQEVGPEDWEAHIGDEEGPGVSSSVGLDGDLGPPKGGDAGTVGGAHVAPSGTWVVDSGPWI